jgi:hypothetical protein
MSQNNWPKLAAIALVAGMIALPARSQTPSPLPLPNPYHIDEAFKLEMPSGWKSLGGAGALKIGSDNNLYVFLRCGWATCTCHDYASSIVVYTQQCNFLRITVVCMFL